MIDEQQFTTLLSDIFSRNGLADYLPCASRLMRLPLRMLSVNEHLNLTAITDPAAGDSPSLCGFSHAL